MNNNNSKQVCTNCKYFQRYYIIASDCTFKATALGHCVNLKVSKPISSKRVKKDEGCDLWQPYELQKLRVKYGVEQGIQFYGKIVEDLLVAFYNIE